MTLRDAVQEVLELGAGGTLFRVKWELALRAGMIQFAEPPGWRLEAKLDAVPFERPEEVARAMEGRVGARARAELVRIAEEATRGRIVCFGSWAAEFGSPVDWNLNPRTGERWRPDAPWRAALADEARVGDVKLTWEAARFPQAFHFARAAAFEPGRRAAFAQAFEAQVASFVAAAPFGRGIHWFSCQESVQRALAWIFAHRALGGGEELLATIARQAARTVAQIEATIAFSEHAVYNNHLIAEALGLLVLPSVSPGLPDAEARRRRGLEILTREADRQLDADGAYIAHSFNYERTALMHYLVAIAFLRAQGARISEPITGALERALDHLVAHQEPSSGRLPNFGCNDGSMPYVLSTCEFPDFRPVLQATSLATRGERLYEPGPWDEAAAWLFGAASLDAPIRSPSRRSFAFSKAGYFVLRGRDERSFGTFRCGTLRDRFAQIDMLHVDVWWRGLNVAVDAGSYLYNGPARWNEHFTRTGCHNTVVVDGADQMLHHRRFKLVHWTRARALFFEDTEATARAAGEHYGFARLPGGVVHRRSVLFVKDDAWIVVDQLRGEGEHDVRVHWLAGDFAFRTEDRRLLLDTEEGEFSIAVHDARGGRLEPSVVSGDETAPRGWLSRTYGEKRAVPSFAVSERAALPATYVSILGAGRLEPTVAAGVWTVAGVRFEIVDGLIAFVP